MKNITLLFFLVITSTTFSQINTFYVKPVLTDPNYAAVQDSHMVVRNATTHLNKLFLFIGGTGSSTQSYQAICNYAGNVGFDVINLSYPNEVAAASLTNNPDSLVFNKYRQEVCFGTSLSNDVTVDSLNSIYTRTIKLIHYLDETYPAQNWNQYLIDPVTLDWTKVAVGGHSQGSGHACYFAKFNDVDRVLMFSGPNDYSNYFSDAANWLKSPGVSATNKHYAYLSVLDEVVPFDKQLTNLEGLGLYPLYDTTLVDVSGIPYEQSHCLYTAQDPGLSLLYHNTPVKNSLINHSVWTYMLTSDVSTSIREADAIAEFSIYPNPVYSSLNIYSTDNLFGKVYVVQNLEGQRMLTGKISNADCFSIDLSLFERGIYFFTMDRRSFKFIKL